MAALVQTCYTILANTYNSFRLITQWNYTTPLQTSLSIACIFKHLLILNNRIKICLEEMETSWRIKLPRNSIWISFTALMSFVLQLRILYVVLNIHIRLQTRNYYFPWIICNPYNAMLILEMWQYQMKKKWLNVSIDMEN